MGTEPSIPALGAEESLNGRLEDASALIYCWAGWCGPCQLSSPVVDDLSKDPDLIHVTFIGVDIDVCEEAVRELRVRQIPSFFIWKDREVVDFVTGVTPSAHLKKWILMHFPAPK